MSRSNVHSNETTISFAQSPEELVQSINAGFAAIGTPIEISVGNFLGQNELALEQPRRQSYPQASKLLRNLWTKLNNELPTILLHGTRLQLDITKALALENPNLLLFLEQEIELGNLRNDLLIENWGRVIGFYEKENPPQDFLQDLEVLKQNLDDEVERKNWLTNLQKSLAKWRVDQIGQNSKFLPLLQQSYIEQTLDSQNQLNHSILSAASPEDHETNQHLIENFLNQHPDWLAKNQIKSDYNPLVGRGQQLMNLSEMPRASAADIRNYEMRVLKNEGLDQGKRFQELNNEAVKEEERQRSDATKEAVDKAVARFSTTESSETKGSNRLSSGLTRLFGQKKKENGTDRLSLLNEAKNGILEELEKFAKQGSPQESVNQKLQGLLTTGIGEAYETKLKELRNNGQQNQQSEEGQKTSQVIQQIPRRLSLYEQNLQQQPKQHGTSLEQELQDMRINRRGLVKELSRNFEKPETKITPLDTKPSNGQSEESRIGNHR